MMKRCYLFIVLLLCSLTASYGAAGDTTWVQSFQGEFTHPGVFDASLTFPDGSVTYRKIYMIITMSEYSCGGSGYCHQWDYDLENYVMTPAGDTLEIGRFITPYATAGTPGFPSNWQLPYVFDVSDYYPVLQNAATMVINYSGYSYGFTGDVKFAFIEGTPERKVVGIAKLWNNTYTYGNTANPIDSNILPYTLNPPPGTTSAVMNFLISGHGYDNATGCCEFDATGVGHTYTVWANDNIVGQCNMNINCGLCEIYPQGGTWAYQRAGNWCPGGYVALAQYPLTGVNPSQPFTTDVSFDDSYNGGGSYGIYKIATDVFYYAGYNKNLDASMEDVIAPTNTTWYQRENPRVSQPVVKIRNTGASTITSLLLQYGVKDSSLTPYIWTGSLAPSTDTVISLPAISALTNLSLNAASGTYGFVAMIEQVNGRTDDDQSNDTITSQFAVAPKWPNTFIIKLRTSSIGADGNFNSNPADASWQITDANNNVVASRTNTNVTTSYADTVTLQSGGFYTLSLNTSQCLGLQWWALQGDSGYTSGSFAVVNYKGAHNDLTLNGTQNTGYFEDDFGCGINQYFTTAGECEAPVPTISSSGNTLTASFGYAYQWYYNGNLIPGAVFQTYTLDNLTGNYTVEVTDSAGCTGNSASFPFISSGIVDISAFANEVSVFPNPARDVFNIVVSGELTGTGYFVYDMTGRRLLSGRITNQSTPISVKDISSGVYLVEINDGGGSITKRIVIQK